MGASHDKIRNHFATWVTEVRRGFRLLDEDHSGRLSRDELKAVLMMFNLDIKAHLIEKIIDLADGANAKNFADLQGKKAARVGGPTIRAGVNPKEVQYAQQCLKEMLLTKYSRLTDAFESIDDDRT